MNSPEYDEATWALILRIRSPIDEVRMYLAITLAVETADESIQSCELFFQFFFEGLRRRVRKEWRKQSGWTLARHGGGLHKRDSKTEMTFSPAWWGQRALDLYRTWSDLVVDL